MYAYWDMCGNQVEYKVWTTLLTWSYAVAQEAFLFFCTEKKLILEPLISKKMWRGIICFWVIHPSDCLSVSLSLFCKQDIAMTVCVRTLNLSELIWAEE